MSVLATVAVAGGNADWYERFEQQLSRDINSRYLGEHPERVLSLREPPGLVVMYLGSQLGPYLEVCAKLAADGVRVLAVGAEKDPDLILAAMRAGACEFIVDGDEAEMKRVVRMLALQVSGMELGSIVSVFAAKGGVGATAIATNLAGALHKDNDKRVCLIDLDLYFGDVLSFLDLPGGYSISDVVANIRRLDRDLLNSSVTRHRSGVYVLAQSEKLEQVETIQAGDIVAMLDFLRQHFDYIVLDGLRGLDDITVAALDASDQILVVVTQDVPAVRNARRCVGIFERLEYGAERVTMLVNRYQKKSNITLDVIAETVGLPAKNTIANDFPSLIKSINAGVMLHEAAPRSRLTRDIAELTPLIRTDTVNEVAAKGFLGGWMQRRQVAHGTQ